MKNNKNDDGKYPEESEAEGGSGGGGSGGTHVSAVGVVGVPAVGGPADLPLELLCPLDQPHHRLRQRGGGWEIADRGECK